MRTRLHAQGITSGRSPFASLVAGALLFIGCSVDRGGPTQGGAPPQPSGPAPNPALAQPTATPIVLTVTPARHGAPAPQATRVAISVAELVRRYLAEEYGASGSKASWYRNVLSVAVRFNTAIIRTDLSLAANDRQTAATICQAVARFPNTKAGQELHSLSVEVYGQGDQLLAASEPADAQPTASPQPSPAP